MGWLFSNGWDKAGLVKHLCEENGVKTLAHSVRGNTLWTVQVYTKPDGTEVRFIGCYRLQGGRQDGWGYKDMCESMGPYYYDCPLKYLDMVPVANEEWRQGVRNFHAKAAEKREKLKGLAVGCKIRLVESCTIMGDKVTELLTVESLKPLVAKLGYTNIRVKPRHIAEVLP